MQMAKLPRRIGSKTTTGNRITRKGLAKKKGGIGLNTTGVARRTFKTNMQRKKIRFADGTVKRIWVRVKDLRSGIYDNPTKQDVIAAAAGAKRKGS
jgi:large subunit ribosomal protein L28